MDAFIAYDSEWRFLYVNKEAEALMGYSRSDVLGKVLWEYFPETVGSEFEQRCRRRSKTTQLERCLPVEKYRPVTMDGPSGSSR